MENLHWRYPASMYTGILLEFSVISGYTLDGLEFRYTHGPICRFRRRTEERR